ncbi:MAG: ABC transporter permease [Erysipelotrichaceae bacterium]
MNRFLKLYFIEQKLAFRSGEIMLFGILMPAGILLLIAAITGNKDATSGMTFLESSFASLITVGICATAFMGLPITIVDYREKKILKHFFTTPCSPLWILLSTVLCCTVSAVLSALTITLISALFLGYTMKGNIIIFIASWFLVLLSMYSIGMLMASLCKTIKQTNIVTSLVYFPMLFLSGATIPFEIFPAPLQKVANFLPLAQGIKLLKTVSTNLTAENVLYIVILLVGITVICTLLSIKSFKWE